jgi:hypothetical protein
MNENDGSVTNEFNKLPPIDLEYDTYKKLNIMGLLKLKPLSKN